MNGKREEYLGTPDARSENAAAAHHHPRAMIPAAPVMPHSVEAEQGVLGSMMRGGFEVIDDVRQLFANSEAFYRPNHQVIYNYLLASRDAGIPVDPITFVQQMRDSGELDALGGEIEGESGPGLWYLTRLFSFAPTAANVAHYSAIVREKAILRRIIATATEAVRRAYEDQDEVNLLLDAYIGDVIELGNLGNTTETLQPIGNFVDGAVQEIKATYYNRGKPIGLSTGILDLDRMTSGLQGPLTYYVGARPAMGKSSLMVEMADHLAIGDALIGNVASANALAGANVAVFSIEMTGRQLVKRILCDRASIDLQRLRDGFLPKDTLPKLAETAEVVKRGRIFVDEKSDLSIVEFRARARRAVLKFGCKLIIIDYLQRMRSTSRRAQGSRELEINEIAQGISATAKELNVPIVVLCQLNRENEKRPDKTPQLSDIRESGSVEQEARVVLMLHRPAYYAKNDKEKRRLAKQAKIEDVPESEEAEAEMRAAAGLGEEDTLPWRDAFRRYAELHVVKQNEGPVGMIKLRFVEEFARFENVTQKLYSNNPTQRQQTEDDF